MFVIENLKYKKILDIPSLRIDKTITCIVGPSGSGKTTLLRHLNRFCEPDTGEIYYNQIPITEILPVELRRKVVMLGQTPVLYSGTVADNLQIGLYFSQRAKAPDSELRKVLKQVGLFQSLDSGCDKLSGGERQRLCLARVMLMDAETYLVDEPSAALDKETEYAMIQNLADFVWENGKQMILVSHSDQVADMFPEGRIALSKGQLDGYRT